MVIRVLKHKINQRLGKGCCIKKKIMHFIQNKISTIGVNTKVLKTLQNDPNAIQDLTFSQLWSDAISASTH